MIYLRGPLSSHTQPHSSPKRKFFTKQDKVNIDSNEYTAFMFAIAELNVVQGYDKKWGDDNAFIKTLK